MAKKASAYLKTLIGIVVSVGFLVWIFASTDWSAVQGYMGQISWPWLLPALAVTLLHYVLRAWRWALLLPDEQTPSRRLLFDGIMFGNFATFLLPLRAGEFLRPWLVARHSKLPFSTGFASVVVERFFDLSAVLICFAFMVHNGGQHHEALVAGAWALSGLGGLICAFLILGSFFPQSILRLVNSCLCIFPKKFAQPLSRFADNLLEGASLLRSPRKALYVFLLTLCIWASAFWLFDIFLRLFQFPSSVHFAVSIGVIVSLAVALPSAPGFLGVYQTACILAFQQQGLSQAQAVAFSLVNHAFQYIVFFLYGVYLLAHYGVSLAGMRKRVEEA